MRQGIETHVTEAELGVTMGSLIFIQTCFLFSADSETGHSAFSFSSGQGPELLTFTLYRFLFPTSAYVERALKLAKGSLVLHSAISHACDVV